MLKRTLFAVIFVAFLCGFGLMNAQDAKPVGSPLTGKEGKALVVVTVKLKDISEAYNKKKDIDVFIRNKYEERNAGLGAAKTAIDGKQKEIETSVYDRRSLAYLKLEQEIETMKLAFKHTVECLKLELKADQDKYADDVTEDIDVTIKNYAKEHNIDLVLRVREGDIGERTQVLYSSNTADISSEIVTILNKKYEENKKDIDKPLYKKDDKKAPAAPRG